jgi:recombination protein RecA
MPQTPGSDAKHDLAALILRARRDADKHTRLLLASEIPMAIPVISSGSFALDAALGIGGLPRGKVVEVFGRESSGKTTLALHSIARVQRGGGESVLIDADAAFNPRYASKLGVDLNRLIVIKPAHAEDAFDLAFSLVSAGRIDLIVFDSVAGLTTLTELESQLKNNSGGHHAALMSRALRKLLIPAAYEGVCLMFVNQVRRDPSVLFGNPFSSTGGLALKNFSSVRLEIEKGLGIIKDNRSIGYRAKIKVVKNRFFTPFCKAEFDILFNHGISQEAELFDLGVAHGLVNMTGREYMFQGHPVGRNRATAVAFLGLGSDVRFRLQGALVQLLGLAPTLGSRGRASNVASIDEAIAR